MTVCLLVAEMTDQRKEGQIGRDDDQADEQADADDQRGFDGFDTASILALS